MSISTTLNDHLSKYSQRLSAVKEVIEQHLSICEVARRLGTAPKQIRRWVGLYEHHGSDGLQIKSRSYSGNFKLSVIRYMHDNGLSLCQTAVKFGIPADSTVLQWERLYEREGVAGLLRENRGRMKKQITKPDPSALDKREKDIQQELAYLRAENAYLKKLKVLVEERIVRESGNVQLPYFDRWSLSVVEMLNNRPITKTATQSSFIVGSCRDGQKYLLLSSEEVKMS